MGTTGKRARRRQKAQEWLERGDSHPEQKENTEMDPEVEVLEVPDPEVEVLEVVQWAVSPIW